MQSIISSAMLKTFDECPRKYWLKYSEGLQIPASGKPFETGKRIHLLANFYLSKIDINKFENNLTEKEKLTWEYLKYSNYFEMELIGTEYELQYKLDKFWLKGRLDALVKENDDTDSNKTGGTYYILDYKTGGINTDMTYDYQTMIYLLAADKRLKNYLSLNFVYIDLKNNRELKIELTPELKSEYEKQLIEVCEKLSEYKPESIECNKLKSDKCEFFAICN